MPTIIGTRHAIEGGAGRASVPVRMALTVAALATSVAVAATMFTAGLDRLTSEPSTYGAVWQLSLNTNYDNQRDGPDGFQCQSPDQECGDVAQVLTARMAHLQGLVRGDPDVLASTPIVRDQITVHGKAIGVYGMGDGDVQPLIIEGRRPASGEIALGRKTMADLHLAIGDVTEADGGAPLRVVGVALVPDGLPGESIGHGGVVTASTARSIDDTLLPTELLVRVRPGADLGGLMARYSTLVGTSEAFGVAGQPRPSQISDYRRIRQTPLALALFVAAVGTGMLVIGLVSGIGRRRREYALLRALGATPGQIVRTIRTTTFVSYALVLVSGMAAGSVVGAVVWRAFERPTGTRAGVQWPALELALAALVVGGAMALSVGAVTRAARSSSPGQALRIE